MAGQPERRFAAAAAQNRDVGPGVATCMRAEATVRRRAGMRGPFANILEPMRTLDPQEAGTIMLD